MADTRIHLPTPQECHKILEKGLAEDYPEESVELGENWETIALVFYTAGIYAGANCLADGLSSAMEERDAGKN